MADTPDPQELARRYLDLWQQHLTQAATDPDLAATMAKFWQGLQAGFWPGMAGGTANAGIAHNAGSTDDADRSDPVPERAPGTASDPAPPDGGGGTLNQLLDRLATLEKRLDAMERKPRSSGKRAPKGPEKSRP